MRYTIADIANAVAARAEGAVQQEVRRVAHPSEAGPGDLAVAFDDAHAALLATGSARMAIVSEGRDWRALGLDAAILVGRPRYALAGLTEAFAKPHGLEPGAHPTAVVSPDAEVAPDVAIGPFCVVEAGARIGPRSALLAQVHVGAGASLGTDALVHPGVRIGRDVTIGERCILQPNCVIGGDGFSFVTPKPGSVESVAATGRVAEDARNGRFARIHSLAAVTLGDDVEIGAGATIDRGTLADTRIGSGTKIDNLVQIGHNVRVGDTCLICAQVGLAGSVTVGDRVVLGGQVGVADHVRIGSDVLIGGKSGLSTNAPDGAVLLGYPAMPRDEMLRLILHMRRLPRIADAVEALKKRLSALDSKR